MRKWMFCRLVIYCDTVEEAYFFGGDDSLSILKNFMPNPSSLVQTIWPLTLTSFPFLNGNTSVSICPTSKVLFAMRKTPDALMFFIEPSKIPLWVVNSVNWSYGLLLCFLISFVCLLSFDFKSGLLAGFRSRLSAGFKSCLLAEDANLMPYPNRKYERFNFLRHIICAWWYSKTSGNEAYGEFWMPI